MTSKPAHHHALALGTLLAFAAAACSTTSGLLTSLEDIATEVDRQGLTDVNQTRILSLTGLLAPSMPGEIHRFKKEHATSTALGPSWSER